MAGPEELRAFAQALKNALHSGVHAEPAFVGGKGVEARYEEGSVWYHVKNLSDEAHGVDAAFVKDGDVQIAAVMDGISSKAEESYAAVLEEHRELIKKLEDLSLEQLEGKSDNEIANLLANMLRAETTVPVVAVQFYDRSMGKHRLFIYWGTAGGFAVERAEGDVKPPLLNKNYMEGRNIVFSPAPLFSVLQ